MSTYCCVRVRERKCACERKKKEINQNPHILVMIRACECVRCDMAGQNLVFITIEAAYSSSWLHANKSWRSACGRALSLVRSDSWGEVSFPGRTSNALTRSEGVCLVSCAVHGYFAAYVTCFIHVLLCVSLCVFSYAHRDLENYDRGFRTLVAAHIVHRLSDSFERQSACASQYLYDGTYRLCCHMLRWESFVLSVHHRIARRARVPFRCVTGCGVCLDIRVGSRLCCLCACVCRI